MKFVHSMLTMSLFTGVLLVGCGKSSTDSAVATTDTAVLVDAEPAGAKGVGDLHKDSADGEEVTMVGRIGGSTEPFVDGLAAFTVVDTEIPYCAENEGCPTPWDYCCTQDKLPGNQAMVKLVDDSGQPIAESASKLLGIKELAVVVVKGKANRDDAGNLSVTANQVFVKERK